ncbi:MarR family transcriptional regulator [Nonomuraea sp. NPDC046802]|uniref:GbsR/MarR family transcriptional regulator n=1 Tax=Nonomuraea sp. NPDC046802 TaxID=3154919 RepID=UPI0033DBEF3D
MPGGRLTHEDRGQIAIWLAEGLGYAEIARRLGRPTSTISREVARNAGPGGYAAEGAQRAAGRRARRRRPIQAVEQPSDDGFVERFATLLAGTGLPRMPARVFACLITADSESLTSAGLVRRLQVSPASVSKAIAYLEAMDLVRREQDPRGRRERYIIDDDVWLRAWRTDTGAHAEVADATRQGIEIFGADTLAGARLSRMGGFFSQLSEQMNGGLAEGIARDALTVLAALVHAGRPLTVDELAKALDWPRRRAADALDTVERRPAIADPLALRRGETGTYTITTRQDRLSPAQREALLKFQEPR